MRILGGGQSCPQPSFKRLPRLRRETSPATEHRLKAGRSRYWLPHIVLLLSSGLIAAHAGSLPEKLIEEGHWKQARAIVEARIRVAPDDPLANFLLSQIRNAFGDLDSPMRFAEKAVSLDGGNAKYHRQLAEVCGVMAQHAGLWQQLLLARRFRKEIEAALALDPRDIQARRDLMEFYLLAPGIAGGDAQKAETVASEIAAIDSAQGFLARARLAAFHKDVTKTEAMLRKAVEAQPEDYRARVALAEFYLEAGRASGGRAEEQAHEAVRLGRDRVEGYAVLAQVYADRQAWNDLDSILDTAAKEVPADAAPCYRAAERLLACACDMPRAERYLRRYLSQEPEGNEPSAAEAHGKLGLALEKQARKKEAAAEWKEAAELKRTRRAPSP